MRHKHGWELRSIRSLVEEKPERPLKGTTRVYRYVEIQDNDKASGTIDESGLQRGEMEILPKRATKVIKQNDIIFAKTRPLPSTLVAATLTACGQHHHGDNIPAPTSPSAAPVSSAPAFPAAPVEVVCVPRRPLGGRPMVVHPSRIARRFARRLAAIISPSVTHNPPVVGAPATLQPQPPSSPDPPLLLAVDPPLLLAVDPPLLLVDPLLLALVGTPPAPPAPLVELVLLAALVLLAPVPPAPPVPCAGGVHVPATQVPTLHGAPSLLAGLEQPPWGSQLPASWHSSIAAQAIALPGLQLPARQASIAVQPLPSSHPAPSAFAGFEQVPLAGSHAPAE